MRDNRHYCSGVCCLIRKRCGRYLPEPPDVHLEWIDHEYDKETGTCPNYLTPLEFEYEKD